MNSEENIDIRRAAALVIANASSDTLNLARVSKLWKLRSLGFWKICEHLTVGKVWWFNSLRIYGLSETDFLRPEHGLSRHHFSGAVLVLGSVVVDIAGIDPCDF